MKELLKLCAAGLVSVLIFATCGQQAQPDAKPLAEVEPQRNRTYELAGGFLKVIEWWDDYGRVCTAIMSVRSYGYPAIDCDWPSASQ